MSISLLTIVQQNLGYSPLQKIDPNTGQVMSAGEDSHGDAFSQAAIPAVLVGLNKYVQTDAGAEAFLRGENSTNWVDKIFIDNKDEIIQNISVYAGQSKEELVLKLNKIAAEAEKVTNQNLPVPASIKDLKTFFSNQKKDILLYLPATLNLGSLLHNDSIDDNTNKMEGPVSSLMRNIGSAFSNPVTEEDKHLKD